MRFVCSDQTYDVLDRAAVAFNMALLPTQKFIDLADDRLITIARALGMEELPPSNEEAMQRLGVIGDVRFETNATPEQLEQMAKQVAFTAQQIFYPRRHGKTQAIEMVANLMQNANIQVESGNLAAVEDETETESPGEGIQLDGQMAAGPDVTVKTEVRSCEICGHPVYEKRHKTCSQECLAESRKRYNREYQQRLHAKVTGVRKSRKNAEVAGSEPSPLS